MKKQTGKIAILVLALTVCLAGLGVGYALWSTTLTISGTVSTGRVNVDWSDHGEAVTGDSKGVSDIVCSILSGTDNDGLYVELSNAFPGVTYDCNLDIHGMGSIPVHLRNLVWTTPPPAGVNWEIIGTAVDDPSTSEDETGYCEVYDTNVIPKALMQTAPCFAGLQLHSSYDVRFTLRFTVPQLETNQGIVANISGYVEARQFNEP
jgi:hypothetical protein